MNKLVKLQFYNRVPNSFATSYLSLNKSFFKKYFQILSAVEKTIRHIPVNLLLKTKIKKQ